ncbi:MAG: hypothetical protein ACMG6E_07615 [Candidatus Roizmanbacteria bacterium]
MYGGTNHLLVIAMRIDFQYSIFNRQIYSFMNYLSDIGGASSSLIFVGKLFMIFFGD